MSFDFRKKKGTFEHRNREPYGNVLVGISKSISGTKGNSLLVFKAVPKKFQAGEKESHLNEIQ